MGLTRALLEEIKLKAKNDVVYVIPLEFEDEEKIVEAMGDDFKLCFAEVPFQASFIVDDDSVEDVEDFEIEYHKPFSCNLFHSVSPLKWLEGGKIGIETKIDTSFIDEWEDLHHENWSPDTYYPNIFAHVKSLLFTLK